MNGHVWEALIDREQAADWKAKPELISVQASEGRMRIRVLKGDGSPGDQFRQAAPTLEDYYLSLVGAAGKVA